jgi:bifunctional aspartokinase / homoserine dehydrogenase 1
MASWVVFKFGGTSMGSAQRIKNVAEICTKFLQPSNENHPPQHLGVVVSAMSGVTDQLLSLVPSALERRGDLEQKIESIAVKHRETAKELLTVAGQSKFLEQLEPDLLALRDLLKAASLIRECPDRILDFVGGLGEVWSATLLNIYLQENQQDSRFLDARKVLTVEPDHPSPTILWTETEVAIAPLKAQAPQIFVITGFVCRTIADVPATLGRNGSDYSASIFGYLFNAEEIVIWTDVDGVMSADPRRVPNSLVIPHLSYKEAVELAYFGAKVIHPLTIVPAVAKGIPVRIKNTFNPDYPGSLISAERKADEVYPVKGCTTVDKVAIIGIEISGMHTLTTISMRAFSALNHEKVRIILATAGSPGNAISLIVPGNQAEKARTALDREFSTEIRQHDVRPISVKQDHSILTIAGEGMVGNIGLASRFFSSLSSAGINTHAIAQGAEEINISAVIANRDTDKALQAAHAGFYLSPQTLHLGIIGENEITEAFVATLSKCEQQLTDMNINIKVAGQLSRNKLTLIGSDAKKTVTIADSNTEQFLNHVTSPAFPHAVIVDTSDWANNAELYAHWLQRGAHIITANPWANAAEYECYHLLQQVMRQHQHHYLYESTICGSLPIIETLADITQSGDRVIRIEGVFSRILSDTIRFLEDGMAGKQAYDALINAGYSDRTIYEGLTGIETKRTVVSLAREIGMRLDLEEVTLPSLFGAFDKNTTFNESTAKDLALQFARNWKELRPTSSSRGEVLMPVATIEPEGKAYLELKTVAPQEACRRDNNATIIAIYTQRFAKDPLVISGARSGPSGVAGGLFADLLRLTRYLGSMG